MFVSDIKLFDAVFRFIIHIYNYKLQLFNIFNKLIDIGRLYKKIDKIFR